MKKVFRRISVSSKGARSGGKTVGQKQLATIDAVVESPAPISLKIISRGVEIRHASLFAHPETTRELLSRVFTVPEVETMEINSRTGRGRIRHNRAVDAPSVWRKLGAALALPGGESARLLYLEHARPFRTRVSRVGDVLSTWTVAAQSRSRIRLTHPLLKNRREIAYRLEEELTSVFGVKSFRTNTFTASVDIYFRPGSLTASRLVRHLEAAWPQLVSGLAGPPSGKRFVAATSMLGLAFTGQFLFPPLLPVALAAVAAYGAPNVIGALKLIRRGHVALPVLYTGTLTFTLLSGLPFSATLMATMMQWWPRWGYQTMTTGQRRLFANHRQRVTWARLAGQKGPELEVAVDQLKIGHVISVREGEVVPVDGVIVSGLAAVDEEALTGRSGAFDKAPGDLVFAATYLRAGRIDVRLTHAGADSLAGHIGEQLPRGFFPDLPSASEAEDVANGMVAPTLALAGLNLVVTGEVQPSQSTLRPDYATSPRLASQMATLQSLSDGLRRGVLFRDPAALDRLPGTDIYIFDDSVALERRRIAVGEVLATADVSHDQILGRAASAFPSFQNERARALMERCLRVGAPLQEVKDRSREAGAISYRDAEGHLIQVVAPAWITANKIRVPRALATAVRKTASAWKDSKKFTPHGEPQLRPLWMVCDGDVQGLVTFHRAGEYEAVEVIGTLRARNPNARFLLISRQSQARASELASAIGISTAFGNLSPADKVRIIEGFGCRTMWVGEGASPASVDCIKASTVSVSVSGATTVTKDQADVVLLQPTVRSLVPMRRLGRLHRKLLKNGYRAVFSANLLCLAGAFVGEFTTLTVAIVSNFGTGAVFAAHRQQINALASRMEAHMGTRISAELEDQEDAEESGMDELESLEEYGGHHHDNEPGSEIAV